MSQAIHGIGEAAPTLIQLMENPDDSNDWLESLDSYQKYKLLERFYQQSLFPFLEWLHMSLTLTWQGLTEKLVYECQFNERQFLTVAKPSELHEPFIQFGQSNPDELPSVQIRIQLSVKSEFNHPNGTGALLTFRYINGYYDLSDDWVESKIAHRVDEQLRLNESNQLIQDIQAHLLFALSNEHPSIIAPKSFYNSNNNFPK